jgi:tripartite-type tricarboxylate transporter receptor subunit TctC
MTRTCSIAAALALTGALVWGALLSGARLRVTATAAAQVAAGPVRIYVPFAPGGPTDVVARILADMLSTRWGGRTVIVASPQFAERTRGLGIDAWGNRPAELDAWMRTEIAKWAQIARDASLKAE